MSVKTPSVGQLAFKGNIARAIRKLIAANKSINLWLKSHQGWPVVLMNKGDLTRLATLAAIAGVALIQRVPPAKPQ